MLHTQVRTQPQTAFLICLRKKKTKTQISLYHWVSSQPERLQTLVAYHNRVVTEGLTPSVGNISRILSEKKFISSCNELKTNYCHHSLMHCQWGPETTSSTYQLHAGHQPPNSNTSALQKGFPSYNNNKENIL